MFAYLIWNPDRNIFVIPYLHHPVTWYGFLFALGFLCGLFLIRKIFMDFLLAYKSPEGDARLEATQLTDRLAILGVIGGILGARLGHVFFYDWTYYRQHPADIFKIWQGGLASHGGAVGVFLVLFVFVWLSRKQMPRLTFLTVLDAIVIPVAFLGGCIRVGNFINQEITGIPTQLPWGVIFLNPLDGVAHVPVHPVQLYEAFFYFLVFIFLVVLWHRNKKGLGTGALSGWFFILVFSFRFAIEYLKMPQNVSFDTSAWLRMGQMLSIPFILLGGLLLIGSYVRKKR
jgi:phosphatidylglycerol:prolipoprotein diacylglycerol transferase